MHNQKDLEAKQRQNELKTLVGEVTENQEMTKSKLTQLIWSVANEEGETAQSKQNSIKILIRTLLKSGSLTPRYFSLDQILNC